MGRERDLAFFKASILVLVAILFEMNSAHAYIQTMTNQGAPVRWPTGFKFNVAGNPINTSGLSEGDVYQSVVRSLQRWKEASNGAVSFDYWQGTDSSEYEPNSGFNGESSVYFSSNSNGSGELTPNILGLTQVWYSTDSGIILEADTTLNDKNFIFTTNPMDTSGFGSLASGGPGKNRVYIENVLTHEFGHSLGLSHSAQLQSTMLFMESPEQAHLACDEEVGIHALYPNGDRSNIQGTVLAPNGSPLFGVNVLAISERRGTVLASGLTDRSGNYSISGLEPGNYFILAEPYFASSNALPPYYSGISSMVCPAHESFGRTLLVDSNNIAVTVSAPQGGDASAPPLTVGCAAGGAAIAGEQSINSNSRVASIFDGLKTSGFGLGDRFESSSGTHSFLLKNISGHLEIRALSFSLYSPVGLQLTLLGGDGQVVSAQNQSPVYAGDSGYTNYDAALIADQLPMGDYTIQVSASSLSTSLYPAGTISLDSVPFMVLTGTLNQEAPPLSSVIPFNARCRMAENFAAYQSPPGGYPRASRESDSTSGGCGMIDTSGKGGKGSGPGIPAVLGWFAPWLLMAGIARVLGKTRVLKSLARERARS
jgi:hypothetical protein